MQLTRGKALAATREARSQCRTDFAPLTTPCPASEPFLGWTIGATSPDTGMARAAITRGKRKSAGSWGARSTCGVHPRAILSITLIRF
jgi:hypothetical protein